MSAPRPPGTPEALPALRARFRDGKAALIEGFRNARPTVPAASKLLRGLAHHVDRTLLALWQQAQMPKGAALVAVGGYGRGELFPYSDVDVLVLLPAPTPAPTPVSTLTPNLAPAGAETAADQAARSALEASIGAFITACWDIGLEIGSSVRTVAECTAEAERDVTVQTAMLESRLLCGSRRLFDEYRRSQARTLDPAAFLRAKTLEMRQRHTKYQDTPYSLEPNCKESPGGLRDLQVVIWVARAAGLGKNWSALAQRGLLTPFEAKQVRRNEGVLKLIRARLHMVAGRREDRLVFDLQTAVAETFGVRTTREQRASEALMHRYYWAAKAVAQLNQILMLNIEDQIMGTQAAPMRPIDERFLDRGGMLEVASDDLYERDPHAILATFLTYQRVVGIKGLSARTLRALYNARGQMNGAFRRDPVNRALFMQILTHPDGGQTRAFRMMNETSVLGRYLWVFRRIVGQMQHDLFHVYTVDQHILMVLRNLRRFLVPEHTHEYPLCSQIGTQFDRPWVLYVAALFHDVAKGRGGDHSELGTVEVRRFCREHGVAREDARLIEFLVREHLTMSRIAQKEDLSDTEVVQGFAARVGDTRTLSALYLLTVADIRGTSPKVWNGWKGKLLEDLYRATLRALGGDQPNADAEIEARRQEALHALNLYSLPAHVQKPLWDTLELSYFARHDAGELAWHARALEGRVETPTPVVCARPSSAAEGLQVLVYAPDQADLFARICGYFDGAGFSILDAKIHTTTRRYALDTFQVVFAQAEQYPDVQYRDLISLVETQLARALASTGPLPEPSRGRLSRRVRSFPVPARVLLKPDERAQRWLLSVSASDRSGLLYAIARVLARHHLNLQLAKVTTLGERVEDVFLIDGAPLQQNRQQIAIETELLDAIAA